MSFDVDVAGRLGDVTVAARFATGPGVTVLVGPSGAGKSSVLNMIAGLLRPDRGHVRVGGATLSDAGAGLWVPSERRRIGYVFQEPRLFPHRRVRGNLLYGARRGGDALTGFDAAVALLGIGHLLDRWPRSLSGGEAKRVAIGRALLSSPRSLLLDEPLASLDPARREELLEAIEGIRDRFAIPILYVTHDAGEADRLAAHRVEIRTSS